jgi:hypothetical protein
MRALTLLVTAAAALVLPIPAAGATTPAATANPPLCWFAPSPGTGWTITTHWYHSCQQCETAGAAGLSRGDWEAYICGFVPIGLDGEYFIFVPEATE